MPDGDVRQSNPTPMDDLAAAKAGAAPPADEETARGKKPWALALVLLALSGAVAWLLVGSDDPFVYSYTVGQVAADPASFVDRELRVEGALTEGSIRFRQDPCEWRFSLTEGERTMPVEFHQCVVPDTFRDHMGISVVVQGRVSEDGSFVASDVIPRCPSRYEMDERSGRGETMPHSAVVRETPPPPES